LVLSIVTVHVPVPEQAPPQPAKLEPAEAAAFRVTTAPEAKVAEQTEPQLIAVEPEVVTVPLPLPVVLTNRAFVMLDSGAKVAVTNWALTIDTIHDPVPVQYPLQPMNPDPDAGIAVSVTEVP
jgi:hypothetical protein